MIFLFLWHFQKSFKNQIGNIWLNYMLRYLSLSELNVFSKGGSSSTTPTPWNLEFLLEKYQRLCYQIQGITLKVRPYRTMCKNGKLKSKTQDSMDTSYLF
jgi:hypothetical protein